MSDDRQFARTWQEIAAHASKETDPKKMQKLAEKLSHALQERQKRMHERMHEKRDAA
jgi:hypothetical protein